MAQLGSYWSWCWSHRAEEGRSYAEVCKSEKAVRSIRAGCEYRSGKAGNGHRAESANGAGKSTTFRAALNLIGTDSGEIRLFGKDVKADAAG